MTEPVDAVDASSAEPYLTDDEVMRMMQKVSPLYQMLKHDRAR